jgi:hypothetical protein
VKQLGQKAAGTAVGRVVTAGVGAASKLAQRTVGRGLAAVEGASTKVGQRLAGTAVGGRLAAVSARAGAALSSMAKSADQRIAGAIEEAVGANKPLFRRLSDAEFDAGFEGYNLGPFVKKVPAKGMSGVGPKLGEKPGGIWFHDNLRVTGVEGAPGGRPVNIRVHSTNPKFPEQGYTLQINTHITNEATQGPTHYMTAEGSWHVLDKNDRALMERLHISAGNFKVKGN